MQQMVQLLMYQLLPTADVQGFDDPYFKFTGGDLTLEKVIGQTVLRILKTLLHLQFLLRTLQHPTLLL